MKLLKITILGILLLSIFSCSSEEQSGGKTEVHYHLGHDHNHDSEASTISAVDTPFKGHGVDFTIPKGWEKLETPILEVGVLIMVEKAGGDESGQFMISVLDGDKIPLGTYMENMREEILKSLKMQEVEGKFTPTRVEKFNGIDAHVCEYEHQSGGLDFSGSLKTFYCNGKTVYLFSQTEKEDNFKNKKDIELIEKTFSCS